ncbi:hypothetical protein [Gordonia sp. (in: high G+C Gram-positive bacteria)]|uniref:hypothetical protein n=1 Tax=Gordonia sp. (in: high G+C Gram-positive bacteria) TaxID=84139 RepID=UPI003C786B0D
MSTFGPPDPPPAGGRPLVGLTELVPAELVLVELDPVEVGGSGDVEPVSSGCSSPVDSAVAVVTEVTEGVEVEVTVVEGVVFVVDGVLVGPSSHECRWQWSWCGAPAATAGTVRPKPRAIAATISGRFAREEL